MKSLSIIFLIIISSSISFHIRKNQEWNRSTIYIGADDTLVSVKLNDNPVDLSEYGNYMDKYAVIKKASLVLFPGDELVFYVKNNGPITKINSAALGVRIEYVDQDGNSQTFLSTSNQWTCDGYPPVVSGSVATNLHYILWKANGLGGDVQLIWGRDQKENTVCRFEIPSS